MICIFASMKWLMIIFSLYVLTLSAIPCCGDDYCCDDELALASEARHSDHDNHNKPELPCSPFFSPLGYSKDAYNVISYGVPVASRRIIHYFFRFTSTDE
jgi:hypothetical protein